MQGRSSRDRLSAALASRYWTEREARVVVEAQRASGLSEAEFARRHGLSRNRLGFWRVRLSAPGGGGMPTPATFDFMPVRLVGDEPAVPRVRTPAEPESADVAGTQMEVVLGGGRRLRLGAGFDRAAVARLLTVLEEEGPEC
jgi:hypothetical protein